MAFCSPTGEDPRAFLGPLLPPNLLEVLQAFIIFQISRWARG